MTDVCGVTTSSGSLQAEDFKIGVLVEGAPTSPRQLVLHHELLVDCANGSLTEEADGEAYLSHYTFGVEMQNHYDANKGSVAGYNGPCCCRYLHFDVDREDLECALNDTRTLVQYLINHYQLDPDDISIWFSGNKGFHVVLELAHTPSPAIGFHHVAKMFATLIAEVAGVRIDESIYDINHIIRLPNTRHPKTGLYKRHIPTGELFILGVDEIRKLAQHPAGDGLPRMEPGQVTLDMLIEDWQGAEEKWRKRCQVKIASHQSLSPVSKAPKYFVDFIRGDVRVGERAKTLFRCAAWLTEQGCPRHLTFALLTEPGLDAGLPPSEVERQIRCGIEHVQKYGRVVSENGQQDGAAVGNDGEECIDDLHGDAYEPPMDQLDLNNPDALDFPYGYLAKPQSKK